MESRRKFLTRATLAVAGLVGAAVVGLGPQAQAAKAIYYVWYKSRPNGRYGGEGPYTWRDANIVAKARRKEGYYNVYIGYKKG